MMSNMAMQVSPGSNHPGGVNLCMLDGLVRFESENVVGTRSGNEALNLSQAQ
jgi:prepilin-type processing-associated H-X9-DG protein